MQNVSKNTDGTYNVENLSEKELLLLASLAGRAYNTYELSQGLGLYKALVKCFPYFDALCRELRLETIDGKGLEIAKYYNTRIANGLKWVAYFTYPDSKNRWRNVKRAVVTELGHPSELGEFDDITGVDKARNAYRRFKRDNVVGFVAWVQEKA